MSGGPESIMILIELFDSFCQILDLNHLSTLAMLELAVPGHVRSQLDCADPVE